jgi:signal transduction histidine kinase
MIESKSYSATGRMGSHDPFTTRDAMLGWMEDIAPYGLFTTDGDLVIRSWNHWLAAHSRLPAEAVIGRPLVEVFPDILARKLDEPFTRALRGEISVLSTALHKYLLPLPTAVQYYNVPWMLQTVRIAPLPAGEEIVGTITIIEDVTQRECHALILRRQHTLDRLLSDALALLLQSEHPLDIAAQLFAQLAVPLKLEVFFNYLLSPDGTELRLHAAGGIMPAVRKAMSTLALGESFCGQLAIHRTPLIETHVQSSTGEHTQAVRRLGLRSYAGFPLLIGDRLLGTLSFGSYERDGIAPDDVEFLAQIAQYVAIALDRAQRDTALREAQQRLHHHAAELETTIAERTTKLRDSIVQLERFSSTVAHDLRSPIRSLMGFTEVLLTDFAAAVPPEAQAMLHRLQTASHRLDALTRDLLKFSRIVGQDVKLSPVDVDELVQDIVSATPALQEGVLTVRPLLGVVTAQRTLLLQCLSNLFENAVKFARPGVRLAIIVRSELGATTVPDRLESGAPFHPSTAGTTMAAGPRRRIWIEDNGIGIAPDAHQKIFGIFERIPGLTPVDGTGIGLAIVARATEQMGGVCGVDSTPGAGSRFWLELAAPASAGRS